jgi:hypothetical protein
MIIHRDHVGRRLLIGAAQERTRCPPASQRGCELDTAGSKGDAATLNARVHLDVRQGRVAAFPACGVRSTLSYPFR